MAVLFGLMTGGVLSEERLGYLIEIVMRMGRQRVQSIQCHTYQTGRKGNA